MSNITKNYAHTIAWMYSSLPMFEKIGSSAYNAKLDQTLHLMDYLESPQHSFKSIHIAGTNGKGSTSHLLASVLMEAGYKVGLFTSPHLMDFRERITVNGAKIDEDEVVEFVHLHKMYFKTHSLSFFEMTTAMAFDHFRRKNIDIAIIETGLGGRLDSTNVIIPQMSIITNIALDHTSILGRTRREIAWEKAGIIKHDVPCLLGETDPEVQYIFEKKASAECAELYITDQIQDVSMYNCPLVGNYQRFNISTVLSACELLKDKFALSQQSVCKGIINVIENTHLQGRWQVLQDVPLVICDTAHNVNGISEIVTQLASTAKDVLHIVFGVVRDKDVEAILGLLPMDAKYYFVQASTPRAMSSRELMLRAEAFGLVGECFEDCVSGVRAALASAGYADCVFVGGSTFVVGDVLIANLFKKI